MSVAGAIAKSTFNTLTEGGQTERFIFRKFDGRALSEAARTGGDIKKTDVETVALKVNPQEVTFTEPKITQKIQTSAPNRFVVFDWGTDLLSMNITGNTGNLLPAIAQGGIHPLKGVVDDISKIAGPSESAASFSKGVGSVSAYAQNLLINSMTYFELLNMSPKYRTFLRLQNLYTNFDADQDVLTLEIGDVVYRGYFLEFSFAVTADMPWNWNYNISFVSLTNLTASERRGDERYPRNSSFIEQS